MQTHCFGKAVSDEQYKDPFKLGGKDLKNLYEDIKKVNMFLVSYDKKLQEIIL